MAGTNTPSCIDSNSYHSGEPSRFQRVYFEEIVFLEPSQSSNQFTIRVLFEEDKTEGKTLFELILSGMLTPGLTNVDNCRADRGDVMSQRPQLKSKQKNRGTVKSRLLFGMSMSQRKISEYRQPHILPKMQLKHSKQN